MTSQISILTTYPDNAFFFKNGLRSAMGLQTVTDYKVIQCNIDMLLMVGKGIRGRICHAIHRYAKANNKCMKDYDKNKESSHL